MESDSIIIKYRISNDKKLRGSQQCQPAPVKYRNGTSISNQSSAKEKQAELLGKVLNSYRVTGNGIEKNEWYRRDYEYDF